MFDSPFVSYWNPTVDTAAASSMLSIDSLEMSQEVPSFITSGFNGVISPMIRVTHEVLVGWNLIILALVLLLVVVNKQLYPRQFRQILSVPGGPAHTNQLLREWSPMRSFLGFSFMITYIVVIALFVQKTCVIMSRDVARFNDFKVFAIISGFCAAWVLLRFLILSLAGWLFRQKEIVVRQTTVQISVYTLTFLLIQPVLWIILYIPNTIFVWIGIGLLFIAALMRFVIEMIETRVAVKMPPLYIFLYLCSLEIVPLLVLVVAGMRYFVQSAVI